MGGNAFTYACPRMPPAVYHSLKARLVPRLLGLYTFAAVPIEAPEKRDYGDLDIIVALPLDADLHAVNVPHVLVKEALGAEDCVPMDGPRTSNFAIPIPEGGWGANFAADERQKRIDMTGSENGTIYYQVDVNVCSNKEEWERVLFFHAHGDMGMLLGTMARQHGLSLGQNGLKLVNVPHPPFQLSDDFSAILNFLHLSDAWKTSFDTTQDLFDWISTCRLFDPAKFHGDAHISRVEGTRTLYHNFVNWAQHQPASHTDNFSVVDEALVFFGKKSMFEETSRARAARANMKAVWNGKVVSDWTNLGTNWRIVKLVMDGVREGLGGDEGVMRLFQEEGCEKLREVVIQMKCKLEQTGS